MLYTLHPDGAPDYFGFLPRGRHDARMFYAIATFFSIIKQLLMVAGYAVLSITSASAMRILRGRSVSQTFR